jgi:cysteine desulfurase
MKRIYLDYAATTPLDPRVRAAMRPYEERIFGNPGSLHMFGQEASRAVFQSRRTIARVIGANIDEIIFTGSATEANNLALRGALAYARTMFRQKPQIIISAIEHESILETARALEANGVEVVYAPITFRGIVDLAHVKRSLNEQTVLVSIMYANNEVGSIQPIAAIADVIRNWKLVHRKKNEQPKSNYGLPITNYPLFHTDASQALQFLDCAVNTIGVDLMTFSSHKIYGPKGIGALYARGSGVQGIGSRQKGAMQSLNPSGYTLESLITGGGQEHGMRSGTENVSGIVGFAKAVEIGNAVREKESVRIGKLRDYFWQHIKAIYPKAVKNTPRLSLPNNLNVYFPGWSAHDMLIALDLLGVAVSAGSACTARSSEPSHVLKALRYKDVRQLGSTRFSLGRFTTKKEIDTTLNAIKIILHKRSGLL